MGLISVLNTALSGLSAAELTIGAVAHNMANMNTHGFKQSFPVLATQPPTTVASRLNGNPRQVGSGVQVVGIFTDESPGPLASTPSGIVELSNTDIGQNLVTSILASTQFELSLSVLDATDQLLGELSQLSRS